MRGIASAAAIATFALVASAQAPLAFEVASVKPAGKLDVQKFMSQRGRSSLKVDKARVDITYWSLSDLIQRAFAVKTYEISGPSWVTGDFFSLDRYDIHATMPAGATEKDVPQMLQVLLVERFKLAYHRDNSEVPVYALVLGKGGPKLKEAPPDPQPATARPSGPDEEAAPKPMDVHGRRFDSASGMTFRIDDDGVVNTRLDPDGTRHMKFLSIPIDKFVKRLGASFADRPVINMTGLKGNFEFALDISREDSMRKMGMPVPVADGSGDATSEPGSALFRSIQAMGLKLEPRKLPVGRLVIDHLEKTPTEN